MKTVFDTVTLERILGIRYKNLYIGENMLDGVVITSNHKPEFYFPEISEADKLALERRFVYKRIDRLLFVPPLDQIEILEEDLNLEENST